MVAVSAACSEINVGKRRATARGVGFSSRQLAKVWKPLLWSFAASCTSRPRTTSSRSMHARDERCGITSRPISSGLLDDAAAHKSRGVAVWENFVYSETDDAHLLCLDARSGNLILGRSIRGQGQALRRDQRSTDGERRSRRGHIRRRFGRARISGGVRCADWKTQVAAVDDPRPGRVRFCRVGRVIRTCMVAPRPGCPALTILNSIPCTGPPATRRPISSEIRARAMIFTPPASWQSIQHRKIEVVLPVHTPRPVRLRRQRNSCAGGRRRERHLRALAGAGQPKRFFLCARSHERKVFAG